MKVEYVEDIQLGLDDRAHVYMLPKCPKCGKYPTYDMTPCPYCGEYLQYSEEKKDE